MIGVYEVIFYLGNSEGLTRTGSCKVVAKSKKEAIDNVQEFVENKDGYFWIDGEAYLNDALDEVFELELSEARYASMG